MIVDKKYDGIFIVFSKRKMLKMEFGETSHTLISQEFIYFGFYFSLFLHNERQVNVDQSGY